MPACRSPTLEAELAKLHLPDFHLHFSKVSKNGFGATKVDVHAHDHAPERHLAEIRAIVEKSGVSPRVKERALRVFTRICEVEAGIHGMSVDDVHLHEVGGVDAIVDVIGVLAGVELLGIGTDRGFAAADGPRLHQGRARPDPAARSRHARFAQGRAGLRLAHR